MLVSLNDHLSSMTISEVSYLQKGSVFGDFTVLDREEIDRWNFTLSLSHAGGRTVSVSLCPDAYRATVPGDNGAVTTIDLTERR